jgi:hypothetical protein
MRVAEQLRNRSPVHAYERLLNFSSIRAPERPMHDSEQLFNRLPVRAHERLPNLSSMHALERPMYDSEQLFNRLPVRAHERLPSQPVMRTAGQLMRTPEQTIRASEQTIRASKQLVNRPPVHASEPPLNQLPVRAREQLPNRPTMHTAGQLMHVPEQLSNRPPMRAPDRSRAQRIVPYPVAQAQPQRPWFLDQLPPPPTTTFIPSRRHRGLDVPSRQNQLMQSGGHLIDVNDGYQGEIDEFVMANRMCSEEHNCAVFILNVPVEAYNFELLDQIREGGIFSFHRRPPQNGHRKCAVALAFKRPEDAKAFIARANGREGYVVRGVRMTVVASRDRIAPVPSNKLCQTRLIHLRGPKDLVSGDQLEAFLHTVIKFVLVRRSEWVDRAERRTVEFEFSSIRGQSRAAMKALIGYHESLPYWPAISINYGDDPCEGPVTPSPAKQLYTSGNNFHLEI